MNIENIVKKTGIFSYVFARIGCVALFLMMGLTVVDVTGRFLFNSPILGSYEITQYLIVVMIFSFIGHAQARKYHVNVEILVNTFPKKVQALVELFNSLVGFLLLAIISWMAFEKAFESMATGDCPMNLPVPQYPFVFFLALGCAIMCVEFVRDMLQASTKNTQKEKKS